MSAMASVGRPGGGPPAQPLSDDPASSAVPFPPLAAKPIKFDQLLDSHSDSEDESPSHKKAPSKAEENKVGDVCSLSGVLPLMPPQLPQATELKAVGNAVTTSKPALSLDGGDAILDCDSSVAQTSESAVSQVSKPARPAKTEALPIWKSATQQLSKSALPTPITDKLASKPAGDLETSSNLPELPLLSTLQQKIPSPPRDELEKKAQIAGNPAAGGEKVHGITDAKPPAMLLRSTIANEKTEERTPSAEGQEHAVHMEQFDRLNSEQAVGDTVESTSRASVKREVQDAREVRFDPAALGTASSLAPQGREVTESHPWKTTSPVETATTIDAIRQHVQVLRAMNMDRLEVIVRPDQNTQLFLRVTKAEGQIQVQARCERGDLAFLEAHWGGIQNSLAAQGIRLEALQASPGSGQHGYSTFADGGSAHTSGHERGRNADPLFEQEIQDREPRSRRSTVPADSTDSPDRRDIGWQSWA